MIWSRWDVKVPENTKVLAVSPGARWLWFCAVQLLRDRQSEDGLIPERELKELAARQGVDQKAIRELAKTTFSNPLLHREGSAYRVHDFDVFKPPASASSTARVAAYRARRREGVTVTSTPPVTVTPGGKPPKPSSPTPPLSHTPRDINNYSETNNLDPEQVNTNSLNTPNLLVEDEIPERVRALAAWWGERAPRMPLARHVEALARIQVPLDDLIRHLEQVYSEENVSSLAYFTSGPGMGRLRELESKSQRRAGKARSRPVALKDLLAGG